MKVSIFQKRTKKFDLTNMSYLYAQVDLISLIFLEEIEDTKKTYRNQLTFSSRLTRFWIKFLVVNIDFSFDSSTISASDFIKSSRGLQIQKCSVRGQTMNPIWWVLLVFDVKSIQQCWGHQTLKLKKKISEFPSRLSSSAQSIISLE